MNCIYSSAGLVYQDYWADANNESLYGDKLARLGRIEDNRACPLPGPNRSCEVFH